MNQQITLFELVDLPADRNPALVFLAGKGSENSKRTLRRGLEVILQAVMPGTVPDIRRFPWHKLRYSHTAAIRAQLMDTYSPASVNVYLAALRGVLKECWRLGYVSAENYRRAVDIPNMRGETLPAGRALASWEIDALFRACSADHDAAGNLTPAACRDGALLAILRLAGLRREEVILLNLVDYGPTLGTLKVRGKGRKERQVYIQNAVQWMALWLRVRGDVPGALFNAVNKGGHLRPGERMTAQAVYNLLKKRGEQAGLANFSPHDLRRTFIGDLLNAGADMSVVQKLAGHASPVTTGRYDRRPETAKREAAGKLYVPQPKAIF